VSNRERILNALKGSLLPLDDDQLSQRSGVTPRQTVNIVCRQLAVEGLLRRTQGVEGKIVNHLASMESPSEPSPPGDSEALAPALPRPNYNTAQASSVEPGSSHEQRMAETVMLEMLSESLGVQLRPRRWRHPSGSRVELDGADEELTVLVECWAHQGPAKVAQKYKLMNDAVKLHWVAESVVPRPELLIICVSDPAAIKHLQGSSWQGAAIADLGVTLKVVQLPEPVVASVLAAQKRQYR